MPPYTLLEVPQECLTRILKHVESVDVLAMRKTCKLFENLTKTRALWESILKNILGERSISPEIYPVASMSLSALEHAALLPTKFVDLIKSETQTALEPTLTCRLSTRLTLNEHTLYGVLSEGKASSFRASLDGRYLVVKTHHPLKNPSQGNSEATVFTLWDIGVSQMQPKVVARMVIPEHHGMAQCELHGLITDPRPSHKGTLYMLCFYNNPKTYLHVYKVLLYSPTPEFKHHTKISLPESTNYISASHQLYTVSIHHIHGNKHAFMAWHLIEDKWASWIAQDCSLELDADIQAFFFDGTAIILSHAKDMAIYNLPEYTPGDCPPPIPIRASLVVKNPLPNGHVILDMPPYSENRPYICVYNNRKVIIQKGISLTPLKNSMTPNILPVACGSVDLPHLNAGLRFDFVDNTNKSHLILGLMDRQWKKCTVSVIDLDSDGKPVAAGEEIKVKTTKLGLLGNIPLIQAEMCSFRGRMFVMTESAMPQLHVLDYVLPSD